MEGRSKPFHRRPLGDRSLSKLQACQLPWLVIAAHDGFVSISHRQKAVAGSHRKGARDAFTLVFVRLHIARHRTFTTALLPVGTSCAAGSNPELSLFMEAHDGLSGPIAESAGFWGL